MLGTLEVQYGYVPWIDKFDSVNDHWFSRYITALYFSVITMITVGYGDIIPKNTIEKIFVIFMTLLSCGVFAYCVN